MLASGSPRRIAFLQDLGLDFEICPAANDAEPLPVKGELPKSYALRSAFAKLSSLVPILEHEAFFMGLGANWSPRNKVKGMVVEPAPEKAGLGSGLWRLLPFLDPEGYFYGATSLEAATLAADTIVVLDDEILGKPASKVQAVEMLKRLGGREHEVITAVALAGPTGFWLAAQSTRVGMGIFSESILKSYVDTGEPMDKAGSYAVQGRGAFLINYIHGSWSNVVGLPVQQLLLAMTKLDLLLTS